MSLETEKRLLDALDALAARVEIAPDAYVRTQARWRWRERCRRMVAVGLAVVIVAAADIAGLWALNRAQSGSPVVFDGPPPAITLPESPPPKTYPTLQAVAPPCAPLAHWASDLIQTVRISNHCDYTISARILRSGPAGPCVMIPAGEQRTVTWAGLRAFEGVRWNCQ
jgi:hypothetical protein